ncbi:MAG: cadmium-translocating P-type ATPase [Bacteriovoracaceae bacterium]|nr:cadmium-translocating P-type ATPase [Bacteriovoracaceae bacterium]
MRVVESHLPAGSTLRCIHCDELALHPIFSEDHKPFCCQGCATVYGILHEKGLEEYYEIKKSAGIYKRRSPVDLDQSKFQFLDQEEFLKEYSYIDHHQNAVMDFYLEGIHCLACLWLIEKLPFFMKGVLNSRLNIERSVATITISNEGKFSEVAAELNLLGYRPHALKKDQKTHDLQKREERRSLLQIGVAAAGASNIMLYAVSLYAGATANYATVFNTLTVLFALPVLSYSAFPFYENAWKSFKSKTLSIDVPISLALILGAIQGATNLFRGVNENYFDSLTMLVFLLLLSRYFLKKIQQKALSANDLHFFYQGESVQRLEGETYKEVYPKFLQLGDVIKVKANQMIPADGIVVEGFSKVNLSLLTGESKPESAQMGSSVFAGTQNISNDLLIRVTAISSDSRIGKILKSVENGWGQRAPIVMLTDRISKAFILTVFALAAILFFMTLQDSNFHHALERALTLLIVTCPCALALATPLAFTHSLSRAAEQGVIIKNDEVIERLTNVDEIYFDKTGTLTYGKVSVSNVEIKKTSQIKIEDVIYSLERNSKHPVGKALSEYALRNHAQFLIVEDFVEVPGLGVKGSIENKKYEINRSGLFENGELLAEFSFDDNVREDTARTLSSLKDQNYKIHILTGDKQDIAFQVGESTQVEKVNIHAELSPELKKSIVTGSKKSLMVGDGANDASALSHAYVSVAVLGAMDISLRAADVYLATPGISSVEKVLSLAAETMKVIKRNIFLSLVYNAISILAAFMGWISPLTAAIIMPISSVTVLLSTLVGTKKLRSLWK